MKKTLIAVVAMCSISGAAYAADNGFYAGIQAGYGDLGYSKSNILPSSGDVMDATNTELVNDNNFDNPTDIWTSRLSSTSTSSTFNTSNSAAGRLFVGYQFNPYFALETGYLYLSQKASGQATYNGSGQVIQPVFSIFSPTGTTTSAASASVTVKSEISESVGDLDAKFILPIQDTGFNPYVKLGLAYIDAQSTTTVENVNVNIQGVDSSKVNAKARNIQASLGNVAGSELAPEGALGIDYDFNHNLSADVSWNMIVGNHGVQNINFIGAGLVYHFS